MLVSEWAYCPSRHLHRVIKRSGKAKRFLCQIFLDSVVSNGRHAAVEFVHLFGHDVYRCHLVVLRKERSDTQAAVAGTGHSDLDVTEVLLGL